jgi:hypothetical protein
MRTGKAVIPGIAHNKTAGSPRLFQLFNDLLDWLAYGRNTT